MAMGKGRADALGVEIGKDLTVDQRVSEICNAQSIGAAMAVGYAEGNFLAGTRKRMQDVVEWRE